MLASWLSAGLLVVGGLLGCLGAYMQCNPLLTVAGFGLLAGAILSGATEWSSGR
ncbi:histidine kinase [Serratia fonticola]|uniref:histidine kinase n=1 Tax=Serratia fonticola TaxID=47917 RepID=UPI002DBB78A7|nr:histidine kinase [Serratia fonticola]MEB7883046.1 histidine kinase [Serratia fonticola]